MLDENGIFIEKFEKRKIKINFSRRNIIKIKIHL